MSDPLVTVGIPVFNGEKSILAALKSISNQSYKNIEIIVSDNCSTDRTAFIVSNYAKENPDVKLIKQEANLGLTNNFNYLASHAKGKYFMWAAHDDTRDPTYIAKCVSKLEASDKYGLCAPRAKVKSNDGEKDTWQSRLPKDLESTNEVKRFKSAVREFPAVAMYGVYRTSQIRKTSLLPNIIGSDLLFIQDLVLGCAFVEIEEYLFFYTERKQWNTKQQDFRIFFGDKKPSKFYSPILSVTEYQFRLVINSKIKNFAKLRLLLFLIRNFLVQVAIKMSIKIIRKIRPITLRDKIVPRFYWLFMHPKSVECLDSEIYEMRIINPRFGIQL
jgi:glycosyltransferase involved in cell wall biosynthesis